MQSFVALLRAVNVGGRGKLAMADLKAICEAAGFRTVRTYIASGNVVFRTGRSEAEAKAALEAGLQAYAGKPVGVVMRTGAEITEVLAQNPFPDAPGNRVTAIFLDHPTSPATLTGVDWPCAGRSAPARASGDLCLLWDRDSGFKAAYSRREDGHSAQHEHRSQACCHGSRSHALTRRGATADTISRSCGDAKSARRISRDGNAIGRRSPRST
jgi:uncharacterized protein (DUF1697 family)